MAAVLLTAPVVGDAVGEAMRSLDPDLSYLFDDAGIPEEVQAKISSIGYKTVKMFGRIAESVAELKQAFKDDVTLDPTASTQHRVAMAGVVNCWESARLRTAQRIKQQAEQSVNDLPVQFSKGQHLEIVRAFERKHREIEETETPAPCYVEALLEQVEQGEMIAERLTAVVSKDVAGNEPYGPKIHPDGTIKFSRGRVEILMPRDPEELRMRYKIMGRAWEFVKIKLPSKPFLRDYSMAAWDELAEWLLSVEVYRSEVKSPDESFTYRPSWATLLNFELQVRRKAAKLVNEGATMIAAITGAMKHQPTFQRHFLNPVSVGAGAAAAQQAGSTPTTRDPRHRSRSRGRVPGGGSYDAIRLDNGNTGRGNSSGGGRGGGGRGGGRGGGNGQGGWRNGASNFTPDGRSKCFAYQKGKCRGNCGYVHACLVCNGPHPAMHCPRRPASASGGGGGGGAGPPPMARG